MVADKCVPLSKSVHYLFMVNMHLCMYHIYYCSQQLVSLYDVVTDYQLSKKNKFKPVSFTVKHVSQLLVLTIY